MDSYLLKPEGTVMTTYSHLLHSPDQREGNVIKYVWIWISNSADSAQQTVAVYTASVSHWGIIDLSSFCLVEKVMLSPQVTPFQKPFCSYSAKAETFPPGQRQEVFRCSWCLLCPCWQADRLPRNSGDISFCPTHLACPTPSFHCAAVLHFQQLPWFKIAPLWHLKVPRSWQAGWYRDHRVAPKPPKWGVLQSFQKVHEIVVLIK